VRKGTGPGPRGGRCSFFVTGGAGGAFCASGPGLQGGPCSILFYFLFPPGPNFFPGLDCTRRGGKKKLAHPLHAPAGKNSREGSGKSCLPSPLMGGGDEKTNKRPAQEVKLENQSKGYLAFGPPLSFFPLSFWPRGPCVDNKKNDIRRRKVG